MIRKTGIALVIALILLIGGCSTKYVNATNPSADYKEDEESCKRALVENNIKTPPIVRDDRIFTTNILMCMMSKGWKAEQ